jgi:hypothetical protein
MVSSVRLYSIHRPFLFLHIKSKNWQRLWPYHELVERNEHANGGFMARMMATRVPTAVCSHEHHESGAFLLLGSICYEETLETARKQFYNYRASRANFLNSVGVIFSDLRKAMKNVFRLENPV